MPRSRSRSLESMTRVSTAWLSRNTLACFSMASTWGRGRREGQGRQVCVHVGSGWLLGWGRCTGLSGTQVLPGDADAWHVTALLASCFAPSHTLLLDLATSPAWSCLQRGKEQRHW